MGLSSCCLLFAVWLQFSECRTSFVSHPQVDLHFLRSLSVNTLLRLQCVDSEISPKRLEISKRKWPETSRLEKTVSNLGFFNFWSRLRLFSRDLGGFLVSSDLMSRVWENLSLADSSPDFNFELPRLVSNDQDIDTSLQTSGNQAETY